jgi:hypothetical protein
MPSMARTKSLRLAAAAAFASAPVLVALACGQSSQPDVHDNIIDDTHDAMPAQTSPPPPVDAGYYDVVVYEAGYLKTAPDGYAPVQGCNTCACSSGGADGGPGTYCFGGGGGQTVFPASCDVDAAAGITIGCNTIPAACAGLDTKDTCPCILQQIGMFPCYLVCAVSATGYTVYCPVP